MSDFVNLKLFEVIFITKNRKIPIIQDNNSIEKEPSHPNNIVRAAINFISPRPNIWPIFLIDSQL